MKRFEEYARDLALDGPTAAEELAQLVALDVQIARALVEGKARASLLGARARIAEKLGLSDASNGWAKGTMKERKMNDRKQMPLPAPGNKFASNYLFKLRRQLAEEHDPERRAYLADAIERLRAGMERGSR